MLKKGVLWAHKWLGLITGLIVFLVSLSGAIYTFHDELKLWIYPNKYFIEPPTSTVTPPLELTELIERAQAELPAEQNISRIDLYPAPNRSWIFRASDVDPSAFGHWNYFRYYKRVFMNPYTGECVAIEDSKNEFFQLVLQLHMNLLLGKTYGHALVAYSTLFFVILLLTGMVLWWPKKWRGKPLRRSLWLNRKAKWKRFNYDMHNVFGFYVFPLAVLLCVTGLLFSFPSWKKPYSQFINQFASANVDQRPPQEPQLQISKPFESPLDNLLAHALDKHPDAGMMSIRLRPADAPIIDVQIRLQEDRSGLFYWYYVHSADMTIAQIASHEKLKTGDLLAALNFDLHTGAIWGFTTKFLVFMAALGCASLPVTGYILWWNKQQKTTKQKARRC